MWNPEHYDDRAIGPMGLHDAYLLDAVCRYIRPTTALEYGGLLGHSLTVMSPHCGQIISVDDNAHELLHAAARKAGNVRVVKSKMQDYDPGADGVTRLDLVFFDASHLYADDVAAYNRVKLTLHERSMLLIHDTGEWYTGPDPLPPQWEAWKSHRAALTEEDRRFVQYLRYDGWSDVTFESPNHLRHGITVLTRRRW